MGAQGRSTGPPSDARRQHDQLEWMLIGSRDSKEEIAQGELEHLNKTNRIEIPPLAGVTRAVAIISTRGSKSHHGNWAPGELARESSAQTASQRARRRFILIYPAHLY